jgi:redox-sensitive bicupin YhaK (pirin superfamily)
VPQYVEATLIPEIGPARLVLGKYQGRHSPIGAPEGVNYLMILLQPGEAFVYRPPPEHEVTWLALSRGNLVGAAQSGEGELLVFERGQGDVLLQAGPQGASLVLGSAKPHPYELHMGSYSVHTTAEALALGEARIKELRKRLVSEGRFSRTGPVPVQR